MDRNQTLETWPSRAWKDDVIVGANARVYTPTATNILKSNSASTVTYVGGGTLSGLKHNLGSGVQWWGLLQFDQPVTWGRIKMIKFHGNVYGEGPNGTQILTKLSVDTVKEPWDVTTVCWNNKPTLTQLIETDAVNADSTAGGAGTTSAAAAAKMGLHPAFYSASYAPDLVYGLLFKIVAGNNNTGDSTGSVTTPRYVV